MITTTHEAPELSIATWLNTEQPITLAGLRGRPVLMHAFQMLCPGCVAHAIPQTEKAFRLFRDTDLAVIGLHTVFEHHDAMTPGALKAFVHEYRLSFPIGIDTPSEDGPIPQTMQRYHMRGTPTTILIGRDGRVIAHQFGQLDDMAVGAMVASALESGSSVAGSHGKPASQADAGGGCDDGSCVAT